MGIWWLYDDLREFGRSVVGCVCCLLVAGPLLLIVGGALLASAASGDTRKALIDSYNVAVGQWSSNANQGGWAALSNATAAGALSVTVDASATLVLTTSPLEVPTMEAGNGVSVYSVRVAATTASSGFIQSLPWSTGRSVSFALLATGAGPAPLSLSIPDVPVSPVTQQVLSIPSSGTLPTCAAGSRSCDSRACTCTQYWSLSRACLLFETRTPSWPGAGCVAPPTASGVRAILPLAARPGANGLARFAYSVSGSAPTGSQPSSGFSVTVRSTTDPWVVGMVLTGGTGSWGLTVAAKVATGVALLAVGGLLTALPCLLVLLLWRCCGHRRQKHAGGGAPVVVVASPAYPVGFHPQPPPPATYSPYPPQQQVGAAWGGGTPLQAAYVPQPPQQAYYAAVQQPPPAFAPVAPAPAYPAYVPAAYPQQAPPAYPPQSPYAPQQHTAPPAYPQQQPYAPQQAYY